MKQEGVCAFLTIQNINRSPSHCVDIFVVHDRCRFQLTDIRVGPLPCELAKDEQIR